MGYLLVYTSSLIGKDRINTGIKLDFIWFSIRVVGGTLVRLICIRQTDLKSLIAYSSVATTIQNPKLCDLDSPSG